ncbi:MAG: prepilin-type N-terminal cleavage/methylation domain-containing protein [Deltaproteobacteria bacterium]|nr:prepilin-type N-terminal cleavage/methylation domain-containing protein [Deltaproteobacteria bacterium]
MDRDLSLQTDTLKGFTLIEVLVSVGILAVVLVSLYSAYTSQVEAIQLVEHRGRVQQVARIVLDRMQKDLESAFPGRQVSSTGAALGLIGDEHRLDFTTLTHLALVPGNVPTDLCEVGYRVEEDPDGEGLTLIRRDDPIPDEDLTEGGHSQELTRGVTGFDLAFYDNEGREHETWNTLTAGKGQGLPSLVRIRLALMDGLGKEHVFVTTIHLALAGKIRGEG